MPGLTILQRQEAMRMQVKVYVARGPMVPDAEDLCGQWVAAANAMLGLPAPGAWRSQIEACRIGLRGYAAAGDVAAQGVMVRLDEALRGARSA